MELQWLKEQWNELTITYTDDVSFINRLFIEMTNKFNSGNRQYHNLTHIQTMLEKAREDKHLIKDYDAVRFAIWFHDIVYNPLFVDNELRSAKFAEEPLLYMGVPEEKARKIEKMILATRDHFGYDGADGDTEYFLDLDLMILGSDLETYKEYVNKIREEYSVLPTALFESNRSKFLYRILESPIIYRTKEMKDQFEQQARRNIKIELGLLTE
ncbi:MAG TPA: hypothetical protein VIK89_05920 [Cytophagaceae bacterium]